MSETETHLICPPRVRSVCLVDEPVLLPLLAIELARCVPDMRFGERGIANQRHCPAPRVAIQKLVLVIATAVTDRHGAPYEL